MRGDSNERWDTYLKAAQINTSAVAIGMSPVLDTDEMRDWEDLDPLPDSEQYAPPAADVVVDVPGMGQMNAEVAAEFAEIRSMLTQIGTNSPPASARQGDDDGVPNEIPLQGAPS